MAKHATKPFRTRYDFDRDGNLYIVQIDQDGQHNIVVFNPDDAVTLAHFILAKAAKEAA